MKVQDNIDTVQNTLGKLFAHRNLCHQAVDFSKL